MAKGAWMRLSSTLPNHILKTSSNGNSSTSPREDVPVNDRPYCKKTLSYFGMKLLPVQLLSIVAWVFVFFSCGSWKDKASILFIATSCAFKSLILGISQHTQASSFSMAATYGLPHYWDLSMLWLTFLKSGVSDLLLVFSVLNRLLRSTALWLLYPGPPYVVMLSNNSSGFASSKSNNVLFLSTCPTYIAERNPWCIPGT